MILLVGSREVWSKLNLTENQMGGWSKDGLELKMLDCCSDYFNDLINIDLTLHKFLCTFWAIWIEFLNISRKLGSVIIPSPAAFGWSKRRIRNILHFTLWLKIYIESKIHDWKYFFCSPQNSKWENNIKYIFNIHRIYSFVYVFEFLLVSFLI